MNKAIRFIFGIKYRDHITPYLFRLHVLPVEYRIKFKLSTIAYKITRKVAPVYLIDKVEMFQPNRTDLRPSHGRDKLMFACDLKQLKNETLITQMIREWNVLPAKLRFIDKFDEFKSCLKTFYFKQAFAEYL